MSAETVDAWTCRKCGSDSFHIELCEENDKDGEFVRATVVYRSKRFEGRFMRTSQAAVQSALEVFAREGSKLVVPEGATS